ncbi:hypothetical protein [Micromonospora sp. DT233]|uniref:hypothetical protein n=1 Tax=Micromonospora sp. DT233 TaxID=3393432 RepID=UPI003CE6A819
MQARPRRTGRAPRRPRLTAADHIENGEARIVVLAALLFGAIATVPPLVGFSLGLTRSPTPSISIIGAIAIVALTVALSWGAIAMATRFAMRPAPIDAIGGRE